MAFKSNSDSWFRNESKVIKRTAQSMGQVAKNRATMIAPVESGDLADSGRVITNPDGSVSVVFGGNGLAYALRRHYENKKNPQTLRYLQRGGDSVVKEGIKKYIGLNR